VSLLADADNVVIWNQGPTRHVEPQ
jgi:hypothetical protein